MLPPDFLGTARKYLDYLRRDRYLPRLNYLIFFVTSRCQGHCRLCFNRRHLNRSDDLTLEEIDRITATAGPLTALLLSGGEPFLREDLTTIVTWFVRRCGVRVCAIPTNGFDPDGVQSTTAQLLDSNPHLHLSVNPSLDAGAAMNDRLRFPGSYERVRETVRRLVALRRQSPRLEIVINTVISRHNAALVPSLMQEVAGWGVTGHNFELVRDVAELPDLETVRRLHGRIVRNRARYLRGGVVERVPILGALQLAHEMKERSLAGTGFRCVAGRRVGVLDADGGVRACELLPPVGNVRDFGCDFRAAWRAVRPRAPARCRQCTHICFINATLAADRATLLRAPLAYLRSGRGR